MYKTIITKHEGYENYKINEEGHLIKIMKDGSVYNAPSHIMKDKGFVRVTMNNPIIANKTALLHRLVWDTFNPTQSGKRLIFKDGDKTNCKLNNLEVVR